MLARFTLALAAPHQTFYNTEPVSPEWMGIAEDQNSWATADEDETQEVIIFSAQPFLRGKSCR